MYVTPSSVIKVRDAWPWTVVGVFSVDGFSVDGSSVEHDLFDFAVLFDHKK